MSIAPDIQIRECGDDRHRGNLLGVQPWMVTADYVSEEAFSRKLTGYMDLARDRGWLNERTVVVWPENIGTWLITVDEATRVAEAATLGDAMRVFARHHLVSLIGGLLFSPEKDRAAATCFRIKAPTMARIYQSVFSQMASRYGVTVVAGSIILPSPTIHDGRLTVSHGPLSNVSAVYRPDGQAEPILVRKVFPVTDELKFMSPPHPAEWPVFTTPAGRLGVLVCADSWYPAPYEEWKRKGVDLIVVPSHATGIDTWERPWSGYDGAIMPSDVTPGDVGNITLAEAWRKYALAGRIAESGAIAGLNVFLSGTLWDLGAQGDSLMVRTGEPTVAVNGGQPALLNLWL